MRRHSTVSPASFVVLAHEMLGTLPQFFDVESYRTSVERRHNSRGEQITVTEAVVKNFNLPAERVVVQIVESARSSKMRGGVAFDEM